MAIKNKKEAILNGVLKLVNQEGFYHLNMKKIANEANIVPGTIYLYFPGKEALINELYSSISDSFNKTVLSGFSEDASLKNNFYEMMTRALLFYIQSPDKFGFMEQYIYSPFLFKMNKVENFMLLRPIFKMIRQGKKDKIVKNLPDTFLLASIQGPLSIIIKLHLAGKENLNRPGKKKEFLDMVWGALII